jgi:hypothetical protein
MYAVETTMYAVESCRLCKSVHWRRTLHEFDYRSLHWIRCLLAVKPVRGIKKRFVGKPEGILLKLRLVGYTDCF